jgi:hypothetical protein
MSEIIVTVRKVAVARGMTNEKLESLITEIEALLEGNLMNSFQDLALDSRAGYAMLIQNVKIPMMIQIAIKEELKKEVEESVKENPDEFFKEKDIGNVINRRTTFMPPPKKEREDHGVQMRIDDEVKYIRSHPPTVFNGKEQYGPQWIAAFDEWRVKAQFTRDVTMVDAFKNLMMGDARDWWQAVYGVTTLSLKYEEVYETFCSKYCTSRVLDQQLKKMEIMRQQEGETPAAFAQRLWKAVNVAMVLQSREEKATQVSKCWINGLQYEFKGRAKLAQLSSIPFEQLVLNVDEVYHDWVLAKKEAANKESEWKSKRSFLVRGRESVSRKDEECINFRNTGGCKFGDRCRYHHATKTAALSQERKWCSKCRKPGHEREECPGRAGSKN